MSTDKSQAKARVQEIRRQQEGQENRTRILVVLGVLLFLALTATAVGAIINQGNTPTTERVGAGSDNITEDLAISVGSDLVAGSENVGATTVEVYQDFTCSWCGEFSRINDDDLQRLMIAGDVTVKFRPVATLDPTGNMSGLSGTAASAAFAVADQAPEHYLAYQNAAYALVASSQGQAAPEDLVTAAIDAGVPEDLAGTFLDLEYRPMVQEATSDFIDAGYPGTPTILVDGQLYEGDWLTPGTLALDLRGGEEQ